MDEQARLNRAIELLSGWITRIDLSNAIDYFDINRVSEHVAMNLLNATYGLRLKDLNEERRNFPVLDLGDDNAKIAFQVTSRVDENKVRSTLQGFLDHKLDARFMNGVRFLSLSHQDVKLNKRTTVAYPFFDSKGHIVTPKVLMQEIGEAYHRDPRRFARALSVLECTAHNSVSDTRLPDFQFVSVNVDPTEVNWHSAAESEVFCDEHPDVSCAFHKSLLRDADPTLDITVINNRREPMVLTHVGVRVVSIARRVRVAGVSRPARIPQTESYVVDVPDIFFDYVPPERRSLMSYGPLEIGRDIWTALADPVRIPKQEPFRYGLLLKSFVAHLPNFCCVELLARTNHGRHGSDLIEMFSW